MPLPKRAASSATEPLLFADQGLRDAPPWMIEEIPAAAAKRRKPKAVVAKKTASKTTTSPTGKQASAKAAKAKVKPTRQRQARSAKTPERVGKIAESRLAGQEQPVPHECAKPIERAMAPVLWRKHGPIDAVRFWLRSAGRSLKAALTVKPQQARTAEAGDGRRRTRNELLLELAVLRQENAAMRKQLGLPAVPFGRLLADRI